MTPEFARLLAPAANFILRILHGFWYSRELSDFTVLNIRQAEFDRDLTDAEGELANRRR